MTPAEYTVCRSIVRALAYRYDRGRVPVEREDLELVGWEAATKALAAWRPGVGVLTAYVVQVVRQDMIDYLRVHWRSRSGHGPHQADHESTMDQRPSAGEDYAARLDAERALSRLPARWRGVMEELYYEDRKGTDIARDLGVSSARITRIKTRALARMARCA
jgi:RNA polymerase sigma factor (sigma-70 family)